MTVKKLKELVAALPKTLDRRTVRVEGCDCTGIADGIIVERSGVLVTAHRRAELMDL